jgi:hypothetical protein
MDNVLVNALTAAKAQLFNPAEPTKFILAILSFLTNSIKKAV